MDKEELIEELIIAAWSVLHHDSDIISDDELNGDELEERYMKEQLQLKFSEVLDNAQSSSWL